VTSETDERSPRRNLRAPARLPVLVVREDEDERDAIAGETIDISAGGAGFVCDRYLSLGARLVVGLYLDDGPLMLTALVRYRRRDAQGKWHYGVRFRAWPGDARARLTRQVLRALAASGSGDSSPDSAQAA
jgi:c-di-GMP-binding flagellar brake protein YcgR